MKLQWATKVVETLLGNGAFRYLSICSVLFKPEVMKTGSANLHFLCNFSQLPLSNISLSNV